MKREIVWVSVVLILGWISISEAALIDISYNDSIPLSSTNWSDSITVPQFDPSLGDLVSVTFELTGTVEGDTGFESRDAEESTVTLDLIAILTLKRPDNSNLLVAIPTASETETVSAYDGTLDFAGSSGRTYDNLTDTQTETATTFNPADLTLFMGTGNITLPVTAKGASSATGSGNLVLFFSTNASADVEVTYSYIPEPATLVFLGLGSLFFLRRGILKKLA